MATNPYAGWLDEFYGPAEVDPISGQATSSTTTNPITWGTPGAGWGNPGAWGTFLTDAQKGDFKNLFRNFFNPQGDFGILPLLGTAALANRSDFFNPPPAKVGFQGTIPQYTYERQQTPLAQQRPEDYRPGQGGITYFTPGTFTRGAVSGGQAGTTGQTETTGGITTGTGGTTGGTTTGTGGTSRLPNVPTDRQIASAYQKAVNNFINRGIASIPLVSRNLPVADLSKPAIISSKAPIGYDYSAAPINTEREQQINALYRSILNRDAEAGGLKYWRDSGLSLDEIEKQIKKIAGDIGVPVSIPKNLPVTNLDRPTIISSKAAPNYDYSAAPILTEREKQINDIYRRVLNREAESGGLEYWRDSGLSLPGIENKIRQIASDIGVGVTTPKVEMPNPVAREVEPVEQRPVERPIDMVSQPVTAVQRTVDAFNETQPAIISSKAGLDYDYSAAPIVTEREKQINDIYRKILNREAESEGLNYWKGTNLSIPEIESQIQKIANDIGIPVQPTTKRAAGGYMPGGIAMLARGRYLKGNGDGVSDSIPARFAGSGQEARLADGEFVIPARVVSELGNGSSDAGARKLYAMLDRVEARAKKAKRGKPSGADRELNKLA
jgi:hypothetical protein